MDAWRVLLAEDEARMAQMTVDMLAELQASVDSIARCRKPVIAAIHGWCIGGGLDMASACDIRVCAKDARFSLREVKMAIVWILRNILVQGKNDSADGN